jgi:hypothetical protein
MRLVIDTTRLTLSPAEKLTMQKRANGGEGPLSVLP